MVAANATTRMMGTVMAALVPEERSLITAAAAETSATAEGRGRATDWLAAVTGMGMQWSGEGLVKKGLLERITRKDC